MQESTSQNEVKLALNNAKCTNGGCNTADAIELAETLYQRSPNPKVLFFTDNDYSETTNIEIVNLNNNEWNVAVNGVTAETNGSGTVFTGTVVSHNRDTAVTVGLRIDGSTVDAQIIDCADGISESVVFTADVASYDTAEIFVQTSDALQADNCYAVCRSTDRTYSVLLASGSPLYLESALNALGSCQVTTVASPEETVLSGYDLYVFDGIAPEEYPTDGSVLVFGTQMLPDGLSAGGKKEASEALSMNPKVQSELYEDLSLLDTAVTNYSALSGNLLWKNLLFCDDAAVLATRNMGNGLHFTVVSFDLHDSNLPMQQDFVVLMRNLVNYSVPSLLKDTDHIAGSTVSLTVTAAAEELYVQMPDETIKALSTAGDISTLTVKEVGIYTVVMTTADGGEYVDFFVHIPTGESASQTLPELAIALSYDTDTQPEDAISEIWFWLALAMLLVVLAEWRWYYHEQY